MRAMLKRIGQKINTELPRVKCGKQLLLDYFNEDKFTDYASKLQAIEKMKV